MPEAVSQRHHCGLGVIKKPPPKQGNLFELDSVPQEHLDCVGEPQRLSSGRGPGQNVEVDDGAQDRDDANKRDHAERDLCLDRVGVIELLAIIRHNKKQGLQLDLLASGFNGKTSSGQQEKS